MGLDGIYLPGIISKGRTMKQYPIWNIITACIYKSAKSYGVRNTGEVEVRVGTSSSNSHKFLKHTTTHRLHNNGDREYRFYIDGECVKRALLKKGANELTPVEPQQGYSEYEELSRIESL
jgi:DNA topoisomerase IB|tara:strand:+ start:1292 stop:1651 length:360 start_codon:yes stop_codon:yes gene_type:complete